MTDELKQWEYDKGYAKGYSDGRASLIEEPKWIPVSDKLPNFNDIVLASADSDYDELRVIITVYSGEEFWFNGKIKAWMPLPEPYKVESEDKRMTLEENIKIILKYHFDIARDEIIEAATKRIMVQIERQKDELPKGDTDGK